MTPPALHKSGRAYRRRFGSASRRTAGTVLLLQVGQGAASVVACYTIGSEHFLHRCPLGLQVDVVALAHA